MNCETSDASSVGFFDVSRPWSIQNHRTEKYNLTTPGPHPVWQKEPHPHHVISHGRYLVVPDLGADLIRVYETNREPDGVVTHVDTLTPVNATRGSGPRHGAFATIGVKTYFYTVNDLGNSISGYSVNYGSTLGLTQLFTISSQRLAGVSNGTKVVEIVVSVCKILLLTT